MGAVDAILAAALTKDYRGKRIAAFDPTRDIPGLLAWFDADDLGANGSAIRFWRDRSGNGQDVAQGTSANRPTVAVEGGRKMAHFGATAFLARSTFGAGFGQAPVQQPLTFIAVARIASASSGVGRWLIGSTSTGRVQWGTNASSDALYTSAGATGPNGGEKVNDDLFHVFVATMTATENAQYVDGTLVQASSSASQGTNSMVGLGIGGDALGLSPLINGDISDLLIYRGRLTHEQIDQVTKAYFAKRALAGTRRTVAEPVSYLDGSDGSIAIRYWLPPKLTGAAAPLVVWSHPYTQTEAIVPSYFAYPIVHALINAGVMVVATNMHGDSWGSDAALADLVNARNFMHSVNPVSKTVLMGASMGGLATALAVAANTIPNIAGAALIDPVLDLAAFYNATDAGTQASIRAVYGIATDGSDLVAKIAGHNPMTLAASAYAGKRLRIYASSSDVQVAKAPNADAFAARVGSVVTEGGTVITHPNGHLSTNSAMPRDLLSFAGRCLASA